MALAAALNAPKSPFRVATELVIKDPAEYSQVVTLLEFFLTVQPPCLPSK